MKKLIFLLLSILLLVLTGCDNNEGPFEIRRENGMSILYSNGKYASGPVATTVRSYGGAVVTVSNINYKDGLPDGNFTLYNLDGIPVVEAKGKMSSDGRFQGKITFANNVSAEGEAIIDIYNLLNFEGGNSEYLFKYFNATVTLGSERKIRIYENGSVSKEYTYYDNKMSKLETKAEYLQGYDDIVEYAEDYYENGNLFRKYTLNSYDGYNGRRYFTMLVQEFYEDGTRLSEGLFNHRIFRLLHSANMKNLNMNEIPTKELFGTQAKDQRSSKYSIINMALKCFRNDGITLSRTFDCILVNNADRYIDIRFYEDGGMYYRKEFNSSKNMVGTHTYYYETGELLKKEYRDGIIEYYKNGEVKREIGYSSDVNYPNLYNEYYENGKSKKRWRETGRGSNIMYIYNEDGKLVSKRKTNFSTKLQDLEDMN